ncbi:aspartate-semialdehyde dehydrogenase [Thermococci archaeon]|nr:MAG: aspartate-semialdehyde dehydrogenase [Thermococci archaeon]
MKVGIIGATGIVGQRFIDLLHDHPFFKLTEIIASENSAGKRFSEACRYQVKQFPEKISSMEVKSIKDDLDCELIFSAIPSKAAKRTEELLAERGYIVASNASAHRMDRDVPLVISEVNPEHLALIESQKKRRKSDGFIITNPNCATIQLVLALKPVHDAFTVKKVYVVSMQAVSGAGYPGVASLDIIDNIIPYIKNEEEKVETEPLKILGEFEGDHIENADIRISASCNRVDVMEGHLECVTVQLREKPDIESFKNAIKNFRGLPQRLNLPSAPKKPLILMEEEERPQPRLDRDKERGMACSVGRVREDPILDFKFIVLGHNTIRGAAGASILNAELLYRKKEI